jgi:cbb3-type cytochrome oxidase subunit 3
MKQEALAYFSDTYLTTIALMIFFVLFTAIIVMQLRSHQKEQVKTLENLPFEGDGYEFRQS